MEVMQRCVLTLCAEESYFSALCYYKNLAGIRTFLNQGHRSLVAAKKFIGGGDVSFFEGIALRQYLSERGYSWERVKPISHNNPVKCIEYALNINATHILCFHNNMWNEIPIDVIELEDTAVFASIY